MIKVNLLRNRVGDTTQMAQTSMASGGGPSSSGVSNEAREALVKGMVVVMFTAGLMFYENRNITALQSRQATLTAEIAQLEERATAKAAEAEAIKDIENQSRELEDKLKILKTLSRL